MLSLPFFKKNEEAGVTLVELMIAVGIIFILVLPLVRAMSNHIKAATNLSNANRAMHLAQELMEEIKRKKWDELSPAVGKSTGSATTVGVNTSETLGDKLTYDDIDDYDGLVESPPRDINNNPIADAKGFTRSVMVRVIPNFSWASTPAYWTIVMSGPLSVSYYGKEIVVTVSWPGAVRPVILRTILTNIDRY